MITNFIACSQPAMPYSDMSIPTPYKYPGMFLLVLILVAVPWTATAQETQAPGENIQAEQVAPDMVPTAPVLLDGQVLFQLRGVSAYPAEVRAQKTSERIEIFAKDLTRPIQSFDWLMIKPSSVFLQTNRC